MNVLVAVIVCGTAIYLWRDFKPFASRWLTMREGPPRPVLESDPMPGDLILQCLGYEDEWAREDAMQRLRELRSRTDSWATVRAMQTKIFGDA